MSAAEKKNFQLVKVYVRQRPFTRSELESKRTCIVQEITSRDIHIKSGSVEKKYTFDQVFGKDATQEEVYEGVVYPLIELILSGYTCTVFAYGQTGTGKTHTMIGDKIGLNTDFDNDPSVGMVPRAAGHIFSELQRMNIEFTVTVSFVEIYNEEVRDLLVSDCTPLKVYDDPESKGSVCIRGLTEVIVSSTSHVYELLSLGTAERQTASTNLNRSSSRSHTIFTIVVNTRETIADGEEIIKTGKLHLIDLAGSENIGRSGATEMRAREAGTINKSLLTLGKVIKALALKMSHIPYRESKLTRILQDSLGGKSKTCMITTFSPCSDAFDETVSALDYAHVARSVANCPTVNINRNQTTVLKDSQEEVVKLRQELNAARAGEGFYMRQTSYDRMLSEIKCKNERIVNLVKEITQYEEHISGRQQRCEELNNSFQKATSEVELMIKQLEAENERQKQNEYVIQYMNGRLIHLNDVTARLQNICEASSQHEDIYRKKYNIQCESALSNAQVGRSLFVASATCLKEIQNSLDNFVKCQEEYLADARKRATSIKENQEMSLDELSELSAELQSKAASTDETVDGLFKNGSYNKRKMELVLRAEMQEAYEFMQTKLDVSSAQSKILMECIFETSENMQLESIYCGNLFEQEFAEDRENSTNMDKLLHSLYQGMEQRECSIRTQLSHLNKIRDSYITIVKEVACKTENLKLALRGVRFMKRTIDGILVTLKEKAKKHLINVKDILAHFIECLDPMKELPSIMQTTIDIIQGHIVNCFNEIEAHEIRAQVYLSEFMKTFKKDVHLYNNEFVDLCDKWVKLINEIKKKWEKTVPEQLGLIEADIEHISKSDEIHDSDIKSFVQISSQNLDTLGKNIQLAAHVGDTPMKATYSYPVDIEASSSVEQLREQFTRICMDDSDSD